MAYSLKSYHGNRRELAYHLNLVLTEALANAICHANDCDPDKEVRVMITASDRNLTIRVFDHGQGFDLEKLSKNKAQDEDEGGRGIQIIYKLMDQVRYIQEANGNVLEMIKNLH